MSRTKMLVAVGLAGVTTFLAVAFVKWLHIQTARTFVSAAIGLMEKPEPFDFEARQELGIPLALYTREHAVTHFLLAALEYDDGKYSGANYMLGRYLLDKDCRASLHYLEEHCRTHSCDAETTSIIERVRESGCQAVLGSPQQ